MKKLIECIPNFSEGRNEDTLNRLASLFKSEKGIMLLDYSSDYDHNRSVYTIVGNVRKMEKVMFKATSLALQLIDLRKHQGVHPRMGAIDVMPFVALNEKDHDKAVAMSRRLAKKIASRLSLPVYLYEDSCICESHRHLQDLRRGEFEGLKEKQTNPIWKPDFGKAYHETGGVVAIGVRKPLIAYNIVLDSNDLKQAKKIASMLRENGGLLKGVKAIGVELKTINKVQLSFNICNYHQTSIMDVYKNAEILCKERNINILYSEIIGLISLDASKAIDYDYIKIKDEKMKTQIIEYRIDELEGRLKC